MKLVNFGGVSASPSGACTSGRAVPICGHLSALSSNKASLQLLPPGAFRGGGCPAFRAPLMLAALTHLQGGARNTQTFKRRNQDTESNMAGTVEGNLQVK